MGYFTNPLTAKLLYFLYRELSVFSASMIFPHAPPPPTKWLLVKVTDHFYLAAANGQFSLHRIWPISLFDSFLWNAFFTWLPRQHLPLVFLLPHRLLLITLSFAGPHLPELWTLEGPRAPPLVLYYSPATLTSLGKSHHNWLQITSMRWTLKVVFPAGRAYFNFRLHTSNSYLTICLDDSWTSQT